MAVVEKDPFLRRFYERIPANMVPTFSDGQLDAIKRAFGSRTYGAHSVDIRLSIPFVSRSYYVVLLAGRERRSPRRIAWERRLRPLWTFGNSLIVAVFLIMFCLSLATVLYVGKRWAGIDVVPGVDMLPDEQIERLLR